MKKPLLLLLGLILIATAGILFQQDYEQRKIDKLRAQHQEFLDNSPYKETQKMSRAERKKLGIPPNAFNEQMWELTMDPSTGRPMPERVMQLQEELKAQNNEQARGVGGEAVNPWVDRGPNNQGGRTRGVMFDPNDNTNSRVFAGGVSGGLWVNDDITDANSSWTQVTSMQSNISVTVIISDPNDSNTFYIGSGESYTSGAAVGRGIWKSTDAGVTWTNIFGGFTGTSNANQFIDGIFYINDLVARDNGGTTELYAAVGSDFYQFSSGPNQFQSLNEMGVYKSTDGGSNWTRFNITHAGGAFKNPNDIELDINNNIWFTTTFDRFGNPGGDIYKSTDGLTFTLERTISGASRTELEPSQTDADKFWVAANVGGQADLFRTDDSFTNIIQLLNEPNDADNGIPASDYTRGQAFYDLPIEADSNDNLYVGGIDNFRSTDDGATWTQISKWSNNNNLAALDVSSVHADIHAIVFRPGNDDQGVIGSDGGVSYASSFATAALQNLSSTTAITDRNTEYNTIQFYYGSITDGINGADDDLAGGTQDNGTQFVYDAAAGTNAYFDPVGGDGGFTELISGPPFYAITTYPGNSHVYLDLLGGGYFLSSGSGGNFINEAVLDKSLNILYSNAASGVIERNANFQGGSAGIQRDNLTNALLNSSASAFQVSPYTTTSTLLMAGLRNGRLLKIETANALSQTWSNIAPGGGFVGSISDIEFGQSEQEIFVTLHNYGVTSIWFTDDGGSSWSSIEGDLPDLPVKCILQNPLIPSELLIGTELGMWATGDYTVASPNWVQTQNGMSDVTVRDLDLRASDNVILATTHGRGFFTSQFTAIPLSTDENTIANTSIKVFPTVSNGDITVSSSSGLGDGNFEVYNLSGQKVFTSELNLSNYQNQLKLNLSSGVYITKVNGESFTLTNKIIIK